MNDVQGHISIIALVEKMSSLLARYRIVISLYLERPISSPGTELRDAIIKLFTAVLEGLQMILDFLIAPLLVSAGSHILLHQLC